MFPITVSRHNPDCEYGYTSMTFTFEAETLEDAKNFAQAAEAFLDDMFPIRPQTDTNYGKSTPASFTPTVVPATGTLPLEAAEATISPVGKSKGNPLGGCSDADLTWYITDYTKKGIATEASTVIMAARNAGTRPHVG